MLTRRQRDLLVFIGAYQKTSGFSPSYTEMRIAMGLRSANGMRRLIDALVERGFVQRGDRGQARSIEIIHQVDNDPIQAAGLAIVSGRAVIVMEERGNVWRIKS